MQARSCSSDRNSGGNTTMSPPSSASYRSHGVRAHRFGQVVFTQSSILKAEILGIGRLVILHIGEAGAESSLSGRRHHPHFSQ